MPTGLCWCDCGLKTAPGMYFLHGHDKRAKRYLDVVTASLSTADQLADLQFIPGMGRSLRDAVLAADETYEVCGLKRHGGQDCRIIGRGIGMRKHRADAARHQA